MTFHALRRARSDVTDRDLLSLWSCGFDTLEIAHATANPECAVANRLARLFDLRHVAGAGDPASRETPKSALHLVAAS